MNVADIKTESVHMANIFRRYLAGMVTTKTQESKSGALDASKLYKYKYTNDIFKRREESPVGLNHGVTLLVDASGSMGGWKAEYVSYETMKLILFCQSMNIPYQVFAFKDSGIVPMITSYLDRKSHNEIMETFKTKMQSSKNIIPLGGSTPLEYSLDVMRTAVPVFVREFKIDVHNFFLLTDGMSYFSNETIYQGGKLYNPSSFADLSNSYSGILTYLKMISSMGGNSFWVHVDNAKLNVDELVENNLFKTKISSPDETYLEGNNTIGTRAVICQTKASTGKRSKMFTKLLVEAMNERSLK